MAKFIEIETTSGDYFLLNPDAILGVFPALDPDGNAASKVFYINDPKSEGTIVQIDYPKFKQLLNAATGGGLLS